MHSGRPLRRSPLYDSLKAQGAVFGEKLGWERPNWFAAEGEEPRDIYSLWPAELVRGGRAASTAPAARRRSCSTRPPSPRFMVTGRDAEAALSWICANDVAKAPGSLTYTQMLNRKGGIECDLTVARLADEAFYIVTGTGFAGHDLDWIRSQHSRRPRRPAVDVTSQSAVLSLMGPRARDILAGITADDISNAGVPLRHLRDASTSPARPFSPCASPMSASSAGSCMFRPSSPLTRLRGADARRARRMASSMPAIARSNRCGWKRAIAPGAPISAPTIRR